MKILSSLAAAALVAGTLVAAAAPVQAATFATFNQIGSGNNIRFKNAANNNTSKNGSIFTIPTAASNVAGGVLVRFDYLVGGLPTNILAKFNLLGTVVNTAATTVGACPGPSCFVIQPNVGGGISGFSFTAVGNQGVITNGSNLLTATNFAGSLITGILGGTAAAFAGSDPAGGVITYTSDYLDLSNTIVRDFSISLTSITPVLTAKVNSALSTFKASANGSFGVEPVPGIPEPASWALFIAGFGMVGLQVRRRRSATKVAA